MLKHDLYLKLEMVRRPLLATDAMPETVERNPDTVAEPESSVSISPTLSPASCTSNCTSQTKQEPRRLKNKHRGMQK
jgi:hypothetical protein